MEIATATKFHPIRICNECGGEVKENTSMEHSYCTGCGMVETGDTEKYMCASCEQVCENEFCPHCDSYRLKLTREDYGQWKAMEADGGEDWDGDSDGWHYCGSPRGMASNIQDAIDELIDKICERDGVDDIKYKWN